MRTADGRTGGRLLQLEIRNLARDPVLDGLVVTGYDITELADLRDRLRASERHQREVVATLAEGVIVVDGRGVSRRQPVRGPAARAGLAADLIGLAGEMMPLVDAHGEAAGAAGASVVALPGRWRAGAQRGLLRRLPAAGAPDEGLGDPDERCRSSGHRGRRDLRRRDRAARGPRTSRPERGTVPEARRHLTRGGVRDRCRRGRAPTSTTAGASSAAAASTPRSARGWTEAVHPDDRAPSRPGVVARRGRAASGSSRSSGTSIPTVSRPRCTARRRRSCDEAVGSLGGSARRWT